MMGTINTDMPLLPIGNLSNDLTVLDYAIFHYLIPLVNNVFADYKTLHIIYVFKEKVKSPLVVLCSFNPVFLWVIT